MILYTIFRSANFYTWCYLVCYLVGSESYTKTEILFLITLVLAFKRRSWNHLESVQHRFPLSRDFLFYSKKKIKYILLVPAKKFNIKKNFTNGTNLNILFLKLQVFKLQCPNYVVHYSQLNQSRFTFFCAMNHSLWWYALSGIDKFYSLILRSDSSPAIVWITAHTIFWVHINCITLINFY